MTCEIWGSPTGTAPTRQLPDTAGDFYAGTPTVRADVTIVWGRQSVIDQPEPGTCTFTIIDPPAGPSFLDEPSLVIGEDIHVFANGAISTGTVDVAVDGSFEAMPPGPDRTGVAGRVFGVVWDPQDGEFPNATYVTAATAGEAVQSIEVRSGTHFADKPVYKMTAVVGPDRYDGAGPPTAWDTIPRMRNGEPWQTRIKIRAGIGTLVRRWTVALPGPTRPGVYTLIGAVSTHTGDFTWRQSDHIRNVPASAEGQWCGTYVEASTATWTSTKGTWADQPGNWAEWFGLWIDDFEILAPTGAQRRVRVFSGEVTDIRAETLPDASVELTVTAVDQLGKLMNQYVGDVPWAAETVPARVNRILAATPGTWNTTIDPVFATTVVSRRDVDRQSAGLLLSTMSTGVDAVLWSATHDLTGPFLWFEDPMLRVQVASLVNDAGTIVVSGDPTVDAVLDACWLDGDVEWIRDVTDVITRVDATWLDQSTTPDVTERWIPTAVDAAAEAVHGARHLTVSTPLTTELAAVTLAERTLARTRQLQWRSDQVVWPLERIEWGDVATTQTALDLLDGVTRLGRGIVITDIAHWAVQTWAGAYLEGGEYRFDDHGWTLTLYTSPNAGLGMSVLWNQLDPTWQWIQFDPSIDWDELWGVGT